MVLYLPNQTTFNMQDEFTILVRAWPQCMWAKGSKGTLYKLLREVNVTRGDIVAVDVYLCKPEELVVKNMTTIIAPFGTPCYQLQCVEDTWMPVDKTAVV